MNMEQVYRVIIFVSFLSFLLTFLFAVFRWSLADARSRGRPGWPLASLLVGVPIATFVIRMAFRAYVPRAVSNWIILGVPLLAWVGWLLIRPAIQQKSGDAILSGRDGAASRWLLSLNLVASGYCLSGGWLAQLVVYPLYLAVPPESFAAYFAQYNEAIVFPVIVALSLCWVLSALLILYRPTAIPSWAAWSAAGLAILGFIASAAFEFPQNQALMEHGYNAVLIHEKIVGNWYRTIAWTLQSALLVWMAKVALTPRETSLER